MPIGDAYAPVTVRELRWTAKERRYLEALDKVKARVVLTWRWEEDVQWFREEYGREGHWKLVETETFTGKRQKAEGYGKWLFAREILAE